MQQKTWVESLRLLMLACVLPVLWGCGTAQRICEEGEQVPYEDGCGTCICKYGAWDCSTCGGSGDGDMGDGDGAPVPLCNNGEKRSNGCNECTCRAGAWDCSDNDCDATCVGGSVVEVDCGRCTCSSTGVWECETAGCVVPVCAVKNVSSCGPGKYCFAPDRVLCGFAFDSGVCKEIGDGSCDGNFDPVCGCDGKTYSNSCEADAAGVSVLLQAQCPDPPAR